MNKYFIKIGGIFLISLLSACGGSNSKDKPIEAVKNTAPVAQIKLDSPSIVLDDSVTISGTSSHDAEGDALTYQWNIKTAAGNAISLEDNTTDTLVFTPDNFGTYNITLTVRDKEYISEKVTSTITVEPNEQSYPIAIISGDLIIETLINDDSSHDSEFEMVTKIGKVAKFSAENSTAADGQKLSYQWEIVYQPAVPTVSNSVIGDATKIKAYLIPDTTGIYEVSLTVTNIENKLTATKKLNIIVESLLRNSAPVAIISTPLPSYALEQLVRLNATASYDSDNASVLNYQWTIKPPTTASITSITKFDSEFFEFKANALGDYLITLEVTDGKLSSETWTKITVTSQNIVPIANAGSDQIVAVNLALALDGAASSDPDGNASDLSYQWSLVSKPSTSNYDDLSNPSFVSHSQFNFIADEVGEYVLALQVFDGIDNSTLDQVYIEVTENQRPVAMLPNDIVVNSNGYQKITTESYDPEGMSLKYIWQLISVPENSAAEILTTQNSSYASFSSDLPGTYTIQLVVNDGIQDSLPATVNIVYTPEVLLELRVTGRLTDETGLPLPEIDISGFFQLGMLTDTEGYFDIILKSKRRDAKLSVLDLRGADIVNGYYRLPKTSEEQLNLGEIKLPVLQRKDISLKACPNYTGPEKVDIYFYLAHSESTLSTIRYQKFKSELTVGEKAVEIKLPATGVINMRLDAIATDKVYVDNGDTFFTHQYQADDTKVDPLTITVCNSD